MKPLSRTLLPALMRGFGHLPLPVLRRLGSWAGSLSYRRRDRMAQVTRRNIERCFAHLAQAEQRELERASLRQTGTLATETFAVWSRDDNWLRRHILGVQGLDHVRELMAEGKGLIVLAPHLGNWEVLGLYLTELGQVTSLYDPPRDPAVEELVRRARERSGASLVPTDRKGVVALFQALKDGHISGILPDQAPHDVGGRFSEFYGVPTLTMTLIYKLIQRTGCRAVFGYARREKNGFQIVFKPVPADLYSEEEAVSLRALNAGIESCVDDAPAQYQWEYKRFKKPPSPGPYFYSDMS